MMQVSFHARVNTECELHTVKALLTVLEEVATNHLANDQSDMASGIVNLIRVIDERMAIARDLHEAEVPD